MLYPSYLNLSKKELAKRINKAHSILQSCVICPRKCKVNRLAGEKGYCRVGSKAIVASFHSHFGEEDCLVGERGSGTIFFAHCNLSCVYCQNYDISQLGIGREITDEKLAFMMIELQKQGCHNINFVTPTPNVPQILAALPYAIEKGLSVPLVYNTNSYDAVGTLKLLDGIFDIYLPDAKYSDEKIAKKYSLAPDYPAIMKAAIREMHQQVGDLIIKSKDQSQKLAKFKIENLKNIPEGVAIRGLLVRHLVLPGGLAGTKEIMRFIFNEISPNTFVNIMRQYRPEYQADKFPPLTQPVTDEEFKKALEIAKKVGLKRIYY